MGYPILIPHALAQEEYTGAVCPRPFTRRVLFFVLPEAAIRRLVKARNHLRSRFRGS